MQNNSNEELSLKEFFGILKDYSLFLISKWKMILIAGVIGGSLGIVYAVFQKPIYKATTTFIIANESGGGGLGSLGGLASMAGIDLGGSSANGLFSGDNLIEFYKSRTIIQKTLLNPLPDSPSTNLMNMYIRIHELEKEWSSKKHLKGISFKVGNDQVLSRAQDSILGVVSRQIALNDLSVGRKDKKTGIIGVQMRSKDERFAKLFNDNIVRNVNQFYIETKTKKQLENVNILQSKADSVRRILSGDVVSASQILDYTPNLNPTRQVLRSGSQVAQVNVEANKAVLTQLLPNLELSKINLLKDTPLIELVDSPIYPLEKEQFGKKNGLLLGGLAFGFICVLILVIRKITKDIIE